MKIKIIKPGFLPGLLTIVISILLWKGVSLFFLPVFLPGPLVLLDRVILVYGDPASYIVVWQTLSRIFVGLIISMLIGTAIGLSMGLQRNVEAFLDSWIMVLLTFPAICWAFLSVLWFGLSDIGPVLTIVLIVFPFVTMNVWEGTKAMEKDLINMARVYKAKRYLTLRKVLIPQLMPYLFSSMRIALSLSWKIALVGEAFAVGSGVGQKLIYYFEDTRVDMMLAWGISFMIVMVLIDLFVFRTWERRTFAWRHQLAA
ncbi:MAG: ABC transporter permease [Deltaproteobacteria bacterium]|nr:ABC transporter permease [Deltaproteobacteria bacterium]